MDTKLTSSPAPDFKPSDEPVTYANAYQVPPPPKPISQEKSELAPSPKERPSLVSDPKPSSPTKHKSQEANKLTSSPEGKPMHGSDPKPSTPTKHKSQEANKLTSLPEGKPMHGSDPKPSDERQANIYHVPPAPRQISREIQENQANEDDYTASKRPRLPTPASKRTTPDSVSDNVQTPENIYMDVVDDPCSQKYEDMGGGTNVGESGNLKSAEPGSTFQKTEPQPMYYQDHQAPPAYEPLQPSYPAPLPPPQESVTLQYQIPLTQMPQSKVPNENNNTVYSVQGVSGWPEKGVEPKFVQMPEQPSDDEPLNYQWQLILLTVVGSVGIFVCCCCGIAATAVGAVGLSSKENRQRRTMAVAALVLNIVGLIIVVIMVVAVALPLLDLKQKVDNAAYAVDNAVNAVEDAANDLNNLFTTTPRYWGNWGK